MSVVAPPQSKPSSRYRSPRYLARYGTSASAVVFVTFLGFALWQKLSEGAVDPVVARTATVSLVLTVAFFYPLEWYMDSRRDG